MGRIATNRARRPVVTSIGVANLNVMKIKAGLA